jgi:hypothetical protein
MIELQKQIYARLTGDATLVSLLGGTGRIRFAYGLTAVKKSELVFRRVSSVPGAVDADGVKTRDAIWQFDVYGENTTEIEDRVRILMDGHRFPANSQTGGWSMHFSTEFPDDFDDDLKVPMRSVRYRCLSVPVGVAQV